MKSIANHIQTHANALNLRAKRNEILASNIANSATPNFKARDIDFTKAILARKAKINVEEYKLMFAKMRKKKKKKK